MVTAKVGAGKLSRLIVFDVEGVLLPERHYFLSVTAKRLGPWGFLKVIVTGFLYMIGLLSIESTLKRVFKLFRGLTVDDLFQIYRGFPLMPSAKEVFETLNKAGYKTALISSGSGTKVYLRKAALWSPMIETTYPCSPYAHRRSATTPTSFCAPNPTLWLRETCPKSSPLSRGIRGGVLAPFFQGAKPYVRQSTLAAYWCPFFACTFWTIT